ncbi:hypothetical protein AB8989_09360 [Yersinia hibernica]|uniref:Cupin domain-containing protein n=1 Tax=Yersinia hibernica TaxID=2339259 RepID=A0ABX5R0U3_9GAMM|nr:hypothetical protein [Yersinia hibernica]QAX79175.1 hypothetical protein D5F51_11765 [Yersinia hibernica]
MESYKINDMIGGWFIGAFSPNAFHTDECEVAVKHYLKGASEEEHYHKIATEITCVISGKILMCGKVWNEGDIIVLTPGESTSFQAIIDSTTVVVKLPGALNDKYLINR